MRSLDRLFAEYVIFYALSMNYDAINYIINNNKFLFVSKVYMYMCFDKFFITTENIQIIRIYYLSCNRRKKLHTKAEFLHSLLQININFRAIPNRDCHVCPEVAISLVDIFYSFIMTRICWTNRL